MQNNTHEGSLAIFEILRDAVDGSLQATKEAAAQGSFCSSCGTVPAAYGVDMCDNCMTTKEASAQEEANGINLDLLMKTAMAAEYAAELLEKQAAEAAEVQPASPLGAEDNETRTPSSETSTLQEASTNRTGEQGMEDDGFGPNHIGTDEDKNIPAGQPGAGLKRAEVIDLIKKKAAAAVGNTDEHDAARSELIDAIYKAALAAGGEASGQPASPHGSVDDETGKINNSTPGGEIVSGAPEQVADSTAQDAERHAKSKDNPLVEPQARATTEMHGPGSGPKDATPDPEKVAKARAFLQKVASQGCTCNSKGTCTHCTLHQKLAEREGKDKEKEKGNEKDSQLGADPTMGAAGASPMMAGAGGAPVADAAMGAPPSAPGTM